MRQGITDVSDRTRNSEISIPECGSSNMNYTFFLKVRIPPLTKDRKFLCFLRGVAEDSVLLGCDAASRGNRIPTFRKYRCRLQM